MHVVRFGEEVAINDILIKLEEIHSEIDDYFIKGQLTSSIVLFLKNKGATIEAIYKNYEKDNQVRLMPATIGLLKDSVLRIREITTNANLDKYKIQEYLEEVIDYLYNFLNEPKKGKKIVEVPVRPIRGNIKFEHGLIANKEDTKTKNPATLAREYIRIDETEKAIKLLLVYTSGNEKYKESYHDFITISNQYNNWQKEDRRGIPNEGRKNKIISNLLKLIEAFESDMK